MTNGEPENPDVPARARAGRPSLAAILAATGVAVAVHAVLLFNLSRRILSDAVVYWPPSLFMIGLAWATAAFLLVVSLVGVAWPRTRPGSIPVLVGAAAYLVLGWLLSEPTKTFFWKHRMEAFRQLAARSEPLVKAVHAFEQANGKPPVSLEELVPAYLPAVPATGMKAYPRYDYRRIDPAKAHPQTCGNAWELSVFTPFGGINFDQFRYHPNGKYPEEGFGGVLERVGDWAYVHE